jgi:hypothetical protein
MRLANEYLSSELPLYQAFVKLEIFGCSVRTAHTLLTLLRLHDLSHSNGLAGN